MTLIECAKLAELWGKKPSNFHKFAVVAWDRPLEGHYHVWAEDEWLALSLAYRCQLRPLSLWKNGKIVNDETIDRFTLAKPRQKKARR